MHPRTGHSLQTLLPRKEPKTGPVSSLPWQHRVGSSISYKAAVLSLCKRLPGCECTVARSRPCSVAPGAAITPQLHASHCHDLPCSFPVGLQALVLTATPGVLWCGPEESTAAAQEGDRAVGPPCRDGGAPGGWPAASYVLCLHPDPPRVAL